MRPPSPRKPREKLRKWTVRIPGRVAVIVKAKTKSEARARVKERTGLRRLPIGTVITGRRKKKKQAA